MTLDGKETFNGMGIIAMVTPGIVRDHPVKRERITAKAVSTRGHIRIRLAVKQIMSGKAISRAVRAHLLLDAVLNGLLLSKSMDVPLECAARVEQDDAESSDL